MTRHMKRQYETLETAVVCSGLINHICAQSVVTDTQHDQIQTKPQESGGEVNFGDGGYNHSWEDAD